MRTFVLAPSSKSNSLGRGISMATTAAQLGDAELWAVDDGPVWPAAVKFGIPVHVFAPKARADMVARIRQAAAGDDVLVWVSKGLHPLDLIAEEAARVPRVMVFQDFDEDDLALMVGHLRGAPLRRLDFPPYHPRSPVRVKRSQARAARAASAVTGTSNAILEVYRRRGVIGVPVARIPHTRQFLPRDLPPVREERTGSERLTLAFLGSIRPHKGLDHIVRLAEQMPDATFVSYAHAWRPPSSVRERWIELPSDTPVVQAYRGVDILLVPQDLASAVAQTQLSAKVIDAALMARAVVGSPTATLEEYCAGSYLAVADWSDIAGVVRQIRETDVRGLGASLRDVYDDLFTPQATADQLRDIIARTRHAQIEAR